MPVYQALNARYGSNTSLQWQVPLYVLPVQAALIVGITAADGVWALALGIVGAVIGFVGVPVMWRIESVARWDRQALDEFEALLLPPEDSALRIMHSAHFLDRVKAKPLHMASTRIAERVERLLKYVPPSITVGLLLVLVGLVTLGLGVQKSLDASTSPQREPQRPRRVLVFELFVRPETL